MTSEVSTLTTQIDQAEELEVLIIGAGFAGIYQLDSLRNKGFNVRVFEAGADIGGTWYWNCYPGARVDSTVPMYQFEREDLWRDWYWTETYPNYAELRGYFDYVDEKLDLSRDIEFNTRVEVCEFSEQHNQWLVKSDNGKFVRANSVVLCVGYSAKPLIPNIEGVNDFNGPCYHTANWPQEGLDLAGKRVAIIGTGASGIQMLEETSLVASEVTVFQRSPNIPLPMNLQPLDKETQDKQKEEYPEKFRKRRQTAGGFDYQVMDQEGMALSPQERREVWEELWERGGAAPWLGNFCDLLLSEELANEFYAFWREKILPRIKGDYKREKLAPEVPPFPFGTKRHSLERFYFEAMSKDHVHLVDVNDTPIERITETGIVTSEKEFEFDVIVFATGFDAVTGSITQIDIRGTQGRTIKEKWDDDGVSTHLGIATGEFPNLLFLYGPQAPTAFANGPTNAEMQGEWVVQCLEDMRAKGVSRFEALPEAEASWSEHANEMLHQTLLPKSNSWWFGANVPGKRVEALNYVGGLNNYMAQCWACREDGYSGFNLD